MKQSKKQRTSKGKYTKASVSVRRGSIADPKEQARIHRESKDPRRCAERLGKIDEHFDLCWKGRDSDMLPRDMIEGLHGNGGNYELIQAAMQPLYMVIEHLEGPDKGEYTYTQCAHLRILHLMLRRCINDMERTRDWISNCHEKRFFTSNLDAKGRKKLNQYMSEV